jgi:hypothetical protein
LVGETIIPFQAPLSWRFITHVVCMLVYWSFGLSLFVCFFSFTYEVCKYIWQMKSIGKIVMKKWLCVCVWWGLCHIVLRYVIMCWMGWNYGLWNNWLDFKPWFVAIEWEGKWLLHCELWKCLFSFKLKSMFVMFKCLRRGKLYNTNCYNINRLMDLVQIKIVQ